MPLSRAKRGGGLALHPAKPPGLPTTASRAGPLQRSMWQISSRAQNS